MKILHVTSHLNIGGVTSNVLSLSYGFQKRGHRVAVFSGQGQLAGELAGRGVEYWEAPLNTSAEFGFDVWRAKRQLIDRLRAAPVDIMHAHTRVAQVAAAAVSGKLSIPYVATWHGFFRRNLGRKLWPCAGDRTIAISEPVRAHLIRDFHVPESRIRLIPHGIDPSPFQSPVGAAEKIALRERLGIPAEAPIIGTVARLVASKAVHQLLQAFPAICQRHPDARLLIVGDGQERRALEQLAVALGIKPQVHFTGSLPSTRAALSLMRVFVFMPADKEGFGLSLLEAMASQLPIVALRRGGGSTWLLDEARVGTVVESGNPSALAQAAATYLGNPALAEQAGRQAREVALSRFTIDRMVDQTLSVYRELVAEP